ncbi:MAG: DUF421 domain-containing protein [Clostridia bacterium]|nr:DUF421 domain-containing protein [Clostridia bacterium]
MEALKICLTAVLSITELFILTKIMGKRQMSQLSLFDYINGITIGSIAAEMAISPLNQIWKYAIAIAIYGLFAFAFSLLSNKSIIFRRLFVGKSLILMNNGKIFRKNLAKSKLDLNEFLEQCRIGGYFNPDDLQTVIMEANGHLSFLPKADVRPTNPKDFNITPQKETPPVVVISDGSILHGNLKAIGKNEIWLRNKLKENSCSPVSKIFLAMWDSGDTLYVFDINNEEKPNDIYL